MNYCHDQNQYVSFVDSLNITIKSCICLHFNSTSQVTVHKYFSIKNDNFMCLTSHLKVLPLFPPNIVRMELAINALRGHQVENLYKWYMHMDINTNSTPEILSFTEWPNTHACNGIFPQGLIYTTRIRH